MAGAKKYSLAISLSAFCLSLLICTPFTKSAWPQDETEIQTLINKLKDPWESVRIVCVCGMLSSFYKYIPLFLFYFFS